MGAINDIKGYRPGQRSREERIKEATDYLLGLCQAQYSSEFNNLSDLESLVSRLDHEATEPELKVFNEHQKALRGTLEEAESLVKHLKNIIGALPIEEPIEDDN